MSGYLSTLVGRAVGTPPAAVAPRIGPAFPVGRQPPGSELDAGEPALDRQESSQGAAEPDVTAARDPASRAAVARRPSEDEIAAVRPSVPTTEPPSTAGPVPTTTASVPPASTLDPIEGKASLAKADVRRPPARDDLDAPVELRVETRVERQKTPSGPVPAREARPTLEHPRALPVVAVPRAVTRDLPASRANGLPRPDRAPRVEVRIGRVEIRRPREPEPVQWPAPAFHAPPVTSFAELAAARRYVDRGWG